ncbi:hypothetical protein [Verrucomicrobium sp. BvORR106]|uniref:hypothetical protein n=1 Tax=Verrucomicrobium sp. BvORR106 TaxID=1403819 RepID=UPI000B183F63|nr:hypothetical protein [Verrucomicrobium sp. BvORR106]
MDYPTHTLLQVAEQARSDVNEITGYVYLCAIVLALVPPIPLTWKGIFWRTVFVTVVVWNMLSVFRGYEVHWARTILDIEQRNPSYDGVGGNVGIMLFGWIIPFIECFGVLLLVKLATLALQKLRSKPATAAPSPQQAMNSQA